jgi:hypothetical protein
MEAVTACHVEITFEVLTVSIGDGVHENINAPEFLGCLGENCLDLLVVGNVAEFDEV